MRPTCAPCEKRGERCLYTVEPDLSRSENLRRRYIQLKDKADQSDELLHFLRTRPESEALDILRRMRNNEPTVSSLLRHIKDGELLIRPPQREANKSTFIVAPGVFILNSDEVHEQDQRLRSLLRSENASRSLDTLDPSLRALPALPPPDVRS